ncbi:alpha/beta hydrolase [bacterium]|nr:MAG: alpha/beta hydrolase [bacterium]
MFSRIFSRLKKRILRLLNIKTFDDYFIRIEPFQSRFVEPRNVDILLPSDYYSSGDKRYPVIYMHDGQNLFDDSLSFSGTSWGVGETVHQLSEKGEIPKVIVVGIWNTAARLGEYMPQKPLEKTVSNIKDCWFTQAYDTQIVSDNYLKYIVEEIKPYVDANYKTDSGQHKTAIMGSSMGGLISMYALCEYPNVFRSAGCLSASWTIGGEPMMDYMKKHVPHPGNFRVYVDYGVEEKVGNYKHYIKEINHLAKDKSYQMQNNWLVARFPGEEHSEGAWRNRLDVPLKFLLKELF